MPSDAAARKQTTMRLRGEMVSTEVSYRDGLRTLIETYKKPMQEKQKKIKITEEDISMIFSNLDSILGLHEILTAAFEATPNDVVSVVSYPCPSCRKCLKVHS